MKKTLAVTYAVTLAAGIGLALVAPAFAEESGQSGALTPWSGVYVAPRLVYAQTKMEGVKAQTAFFGERYERSLGDVDEAALGGAVAGGYDFSRRFGAPFRTELEFSAFSEVEVDKTFSYGDGTREQVDLNFSAQTLFVNAYLDIDTHTAFKPYVGGGLGMSFLSSETYIRRGGRGRAYDLKTQSHTDTNFAWNVGLGLGYQVSPQFTIDLGYRYTSLGSAKGKSWHAGWYTGHGEVEDMYQHQVLAGARFTF